MCAVAATTFSGASEVFYADPDSDDGDSSAEGGGAAVVDVDQIAALEAARLRTNSSTEDQTMDPRLRAVDVARAAASGSLPPVPGRMPDRVHPLLVDVIATQLVTSGTRFAYTAYRVRVATTLRALGGSHGECYSRCPWFQSRYRVV